MNDVEVSQDFQKIPQSSESGRSGRGSAWRATLLKNADRGYVPMLKLENVFISLANHAACRRPQARHPHHVVLSSGLPDPLSRIRLLVEPCSENPIVVSEPSLIDIRQIVNKRILKELYVG